MMWRILAVAALLLAPCGARAQTGFTPEQRAQIIEIIRDAMKRDTTILKDAVAALQAEESQASASAARDAIAKLGPDLAHSSADEVAGNPKGDVTVVEFYDVRCPYCRRMLPTVAQLLAADKGVRWVYKDLPVLGPGSVLGAKALLAARRQGKYVPLHDALMAGPPNIDMNLIAATAAKVGLDAERLRQDMAAPEIQDQIEANLAMAHRLQIEGTPAYVVGGQVLPGAVDLATLKDAVALARD
jgi:protein-disulfide isomerase